MSSTTESRSLGQALAVFALSLTAILSAAALAFDAGLMYVERRDQQNAADAAAIAGARFLNSNTPTARQNARDAAAALALANGFSDSDPSEAVAIHVPPVSGPNAGRSGFIEVQISSSRPSIFAGIMGILSWDVGARAVALNGDGSGGGFSILALDPDDCPALDVTGKGIVTAYGNVQVNSACSSNPRAMRVGGQGTITVDITGGSCDVVGLINESGQGTLNCIPNEGAVEIPDPLAAVPEPPRPPKAQTPLSRDNPPKTVPNGCVTSTAASPAVCSFGPGGGVWTLYPGLYPGGLEFKSGTFYLEPGIYWIGGGGIRMNSTGANLISVPAGGTTPCTTPEQDCGIMIFNSEIAGVSGGAAGDVHLNGGDADTFLHPIDDPVYGGIVFFQDRDLNPQPELQLNGSSTDMEVRGTVYSAGGRVRANGNTGDLITDQVIANTYNLNGNDGAILALVESDFIFRLRAAGLVE